MSQRKCEWIYQIFSIDRSDAKIPLITEATELYNLVLQHQKLFKDCYFQTLRSQNSNLELK